MPCLRSVDCERCNSRSSLEGNRRISSCSTFANFSIQYASTGTKGALDRAAASWTVTGVNFVKRRSSAVSVFSSPSPPRTTPAAVIFKMFRGIPFRNSSCGSLSNVGPLPLPPPPLPPPPPPLPAASRFLISGSSGSIFRFLRFTLFASANSLSTSLFFANSSPHGISANSELCNN